MRFFPRAIFLFALLGPAPTGQAAEPLADLQERVQQAIARVEPSVACILVSRSAEYKQFDAAPPDASSGKLGRFDAAVGPPGFGEPGDRRRKLLLSLDLSHPDHVPESYGSGVVLDETGPGPDQRPRRPQRHQDLRPPARRQGQLGRHPRRRPAQRPGRAAAARPAAPDLKADQARRRRQRAARGSSCCRLANPFAAGFRDGSPSASWGIISNLRRRAPGAARRARRDRQARCTITAP